MPNIKSMIKDVKKSRERHTRNVAEKSKIKTFVKKARAAIETGDAEAVQKAVTAATSVIDKAAEKGIIHKNAAARRKSRLMHAANKAQA
ncbi:MAG TPA: 30S ribosomal protein S20 [Armatimonadota bacterium]|nr:30S ribosomal protein S20 [Armatimonadota bacterium]